MSCLLLLLLLLLLLGDDFLKLERAAQKCDRERKKAKKKNEKQHKQNALKLSQHNTHSTSSFCERLAAPLSRSVEIEKAERKKKT